MDSARPSAAICLAMEKAIDIEETLSTLIGQQVMMLKEEETATKGYKKAPSSPKSKASVGM